MSKAHVCGRQVVDAFVVSPMIVLIDEGLGLWIMRLRSWHASVRETKSLLYCRLDIRFQPKVDICGH